MSPPEKYPQDQKQDDGQGRQDCASASAFCLTMFFSASQDALLLFLVFHNVAPYCCSFLRLDGASPALGGAFRHHGEAVAHDVRDPVIGFHNGFRIVVSAKGEVQGAAIVIPRL